MKNIRKKKDDADTLDISVQGYEVALSFASEPNPQVAEQVRQVLLSACLPAKR